MVPSSEEISVGDLVAEFLQQIGVTTTFGVISIHNIPMLDAIGRRNAIRFVMARGEAGGGHMADAYARVSGELGVLFTSTGPGAANAAGALVEARFAGTPMLHLTGQTATPNIDLGQGAVHDVPDQLGMLRSVSKSGYRVRSANSVLGTLVKAASEAMTPPMGPVSIEIPIDIQRTKIARPTELATLRLSIPIADPGDVETLNEIANMVKLAKRPLLWVGNGAKFAGSVVTRLVDLGIPVITSWNGRGVIPEDHPMSLGSLATTPEVGEFLESVDLLLVAGSRLRGHETADMSMRLPENLIQIDVDPAANGRTYASRIFHCGEAAAALGALADRLAFNGGLSLDEALANDLAAAKAAAYEDYPKAFGEYASFPTQMRAAMPRDAIWVRDITLNNSTWGNRTFPIYNPRDNVYPIGAAIGPGMQLGIGAALGSNGRKVVCMCGDGGFFLNLAELWTAIQEKADIVFVVMNDKGYGVIKHIQSTLYGGRHFFGDLLGPDLEKLSDVAGIHYVKVDSVDDLEKGVSAALRVTGPSIVEVNMKAIGDFPQYFKAPPYAAENKT
ncbi:MAG: Acetolactate synthase isozyme 1 large subunit [Alphaproteobacteria bacterium MarineAlpha4_Bin2]|nr:MAG: Acetolactate synthase isozyme 1 large subunit [Alphaproteobacteria bacterium MarineAlpha4_Bin2]